MTIRYETHGVHDICCCPGPGPWDVLVTLSGYPELGIGATFVHVDCGWPMDWTGAEEINAEDMPMRMTAVSTTDRGPDDTTWFELAPRVPTVQEVSLSGGAEAGGS